MSGHPDSEALLRYADGESPAGGAAAIRSHLEACWQCRAELDEIEKTVRACVRYRKEVLEPCLPAPPAPWTDIYGRFDEIDAAGRVSFRERLLRALRPAVWAPAAVAVILLSLVWLRFRQAPSVEAAELLRKAVASADARPAKARRIRIRTRDRSLTRLTAEQQALFTAARYDWADPLSAKAFQSWRDQLAEKTDEVTEEPGAYRIRTSAARGELAGATLTLRTPDLTPVAERFEFRNSEWVEITELAEEAPVRIAAIPRAPKPVETGAKMPSVSASIGAELRVLTALHALGADLGEPIEVTRSGNAVLVAGVGIAPQRRRQIEEALRLEPSVVVRFSDPAPENTEPEPESTPDVATSAQIPQWQARLAEQLGGRDLFTQLAGRVLDASETMMSRVYALRRLSEQIPAAIEPELTAADRQALGALQRDHIEALRLQSAEIERLLRPALGSAALPSQWPTATEEDLLQSARQVDKLLAVMFGASAPEGAADQAPARLLASLADFRGKLEAYGRKMK